MILSPHPTLFRYCSLSCTLASAGTLIVLILAMASPDAAAELNSGARLLYWSLHVGTAIAALFIASQLLRSLPLSPFGATTLVLLTGLAGTALVTPVYLALEHIWPTAGTSEADDWLDLLEQSGFSGSVTAEFVEALPWTMPFWLLINLPLLLGLPIGRAGIYTDTQPKSTPAAAPVETAKTDAQTEQAPPAGPPPVPTTLQSVPQVYGTDIIAISSDMHYLVVTTAIGKTTVLGNLKDAIEELGPRGIQVHRSHWIAHNHVARVIASDGRLTCLMSNGLRIPVSRRRNKSVREQFGVGVVKRDD